jgi:uncharacterized membrane protein YphA (DoxX/SURF4 family)
MTTALGIPLSGNTQEDRMSRRWRSLGSVVLRCGLGVGFLSAVADRFGLWGAFGQPNVEWGNFSRFLEYTHTLNWYLPAELIPPLGVIATGAEILFGLLLLLGWHTRATALLSGLLLLCFGVAMTLALGIKAPLNFAVFSGVGGALLLSTCESFPFSMDELLFRRTPFREGQTRAAPVPRSGPPHVITKNDLPQPQPAIRQLLLDLDV